LADGKVNKNKLMAMLLMNFNNGTFKKDAKGGSKDLIKTADR